MGSSSFQMKFAAAPVLRSDIGDRLSEVPAVTVKILRVVLALAVRMVLRLREDHGAVLSRALTMRPGIFDSNLHTLRVVRRCISFADGEATLPGLHLDAVIGNAQADCEAKSL